MGGFGTMWAIKDIAQQIGQAGGTALIVGGAVRDSLLGTRPKDWDVEVYGIDLDRLITILGEFGEPDLVGKQFGVIKLGNIDFSLPRKDSKNGVGHKGFNVTHDHTMSPKEAASRRDFTINAMAETMEGQILDFFGGQEDLHNQILRPTSEAFKEDPLRLLRGMQFSARFGLSASSELLDMAPDMLGEMGSLAKERIWVEWEKWALKGFDYTKSIEYIRAINLDYPEIKSMGGVPQDAEWHPEGCVLTHTGHVLDWLANNCDHLNSEDRIVLVFSALCHDMGKVSTTEFIDGRWRARGHEKASEIPTRSFLKSINCPQKIVGRIVGLVVDHMAANNKMSDRAIRRLSNRLSISSNTISDLVLLIEADQCGRPPRPQQKSENLVHLIERSKELGVFYGRPTPIISGDDLIKLGLSQGKDLGRILRHLYELQLKGSVFDKKSGLKIAHNLIKVGNHQ